MTAINRTRGRCEPSPSVVEGERTGTGPLNSVEESTSVVSILHSGFFVQKWGSVLTV